MKQAPQLKKQKVEKPKGYKLEFGLKTSSFTTERPPQAVVCDTSTIVNSVSKANPDKVVCGINTTINGVVWDNIYIFENLDAMVYCIYNTSSNNVATRGVVNAVYKTMKDKPTLEITPINVLEKWSFTVCFSDNETCTKATAMILDHNARVKKFVDNL